ncbi:hypothetical protein FACS1894110_23150 [Spirochaetia bacterium]|nr:hypothetical protein FACS1894110_23150 [Spirochaetia bacterium]
MTKKYKGYKIFSMNNSIRKCTIILLVILSFQGCLTEKDINIKIIREENNGRMNMIPSEIYIYQNNILLKNINNVKIYNIYDINNKVFINKIKNNVIVLFGGNMASLKLPSGEYSIKISTPIIDQQDYLGETGNWESELYNINIKHGEENIIYIYPGSNEKGYNGSWIITKDEK